MMHEPRNERNHEYRSRYVVIKMMDGNYVKFLLINLIICALFWTSQLNSKISTENVELPKGGFGVDFTKLPSKILAILKQRGPGLIWKGGPGCLCSFFRRFLTPKILKIFSEIPFFF